MPYSSGTFSRVHDFTDDRDNGIRIQASRMDAEMDGIATGLSTALLKDGTQTATAKIPFAVGLSVIDNQTILLGTNSDIAIQYDETTNDSLEISANVEGAALGIVLKSDQGDDNADQHKLSIADGGTLTLGSKISGSFVSYLTHTPNSTVASSTLAVAGNLTVGGNLTLGSGAELSEAELEMLDGITAGTVIASKAIVTDSDKDITGGRNITITGELAAATLDISGNIDIDGTSNLDVVDIDGAVDMASTLGVAGVVTANAGVVVDNITIDGTEIDLSSGDLTLDVAGDIILDAAGGDIKFLSDGTEFGEFRDISNDLVLISSINNKDIVFKGQDNGLEITALTLDMSADGAAIFKSSVAAVSLDISGDADIDGNLEADAMTLNGTAITATATLDTGISNNNVPKFTSGVADDDFLRVNGTAIEGRSASEVLSDIGASAVAGSSSIVTTGALNAGSITSGFGTIDTGSSNITSTGVGAFGSLDISGDIDVDGTTNLDVVDIDGAVDMASTLQVDGAITSSAGATITTADNNPQLILKSTDADANGGPLLDLIRDSSSPADNDAMGSIRFRGDDDGGNETQYVDVTAYAPDVSNGSEDGQLQFRSIVGGTLRNRFDITSSEVVFNEDSIDLDFRVESNGNANMLFVDGGNDAVGIGNNNPADYGSLIDNLVIGTTSGNNGMTIVSGTSDGGRICFADNTASPQRGMIEYSHGDDAMLFNANGATRMKIDSTGAVTMPNQPAFLSGTSRVTTITGDGTTYSATAATWTDIYDQNADFSNGTFTAPVTGKYNFTFLLTLAGTATNHTNATFTLVASNRNITYYNSPGVDRNTSLGGTSYVLTTNVDMDASDTMHLSLSVGGGDKTIMLYELSRFSGYLVA